MELHCDPLASLLPPAGGQLCLFYFMSDSHIGTTQSPRGVCRGLGMKAQSCWRLFVHRMLGQTFFVPSPCVENNPPSPVLSASEWGPNICQTHWFQPVKYDPWVRYVAEWQGRTRGDMKSMIQFLMWRQDARQDILRLWSGRWWQSGAEQLYKVASKSCSPTSLVPLICMAGHVSRRSSLATSQSLGGVVKVCTLHPAGRMFHTASLTNPRSLYSVNLGEKAHWA